MKIALQLRNCRIALFLFIACFAALPAMTVSADDTGSVTVTASPTDGHLRMNGDEWGTLRAAGHGSVFDTLRYVKINTRTDIIYRGFLFFDTSQVPDDVEINDVRLHIYAKCTGDLDDCHLYVLECPPGFPHEPLAPGDAALPWEDMVERAHVDVGEWTELAYRKVALDPTALNTAGTTTLCLVERRDYEDAPPPELRSENEIKLFSHEEGDGYQPYLQITWGDSASDATNDNTPLWVALSTGLTAAAAGVFLIVRRQRGKTVAAR